MADKVYMVVGSPQASKNVWELTDDGTTITVTNSWMVSVSGTARAIVTDLDGNFYIAVGGAIYKYDSTMTLITSWASSGIAAAVPDIYWLRTRPQQYG
ncbi:hypothetical protein LCGC14_1588460 [marine sediment metagenome]|uniref:Uncharacterized protein n=1 Tax=marine sediment metagenome TaxID=412755 RepID=A0A0F9LF53_9ZZZZ